jgi:outer membrane protein, multidrug efflux system
MKILDIECRRPNGNEKREDNRIHHSSFFVRYSIFFILPFLSACLVGGRYTEAPPSGIDTTYRYPNQASTDSITLLTWTQIYQDTVLDRLIKTTLDSNRNLLTAAARVEEEEEIAGAVKSQLWPSINYGGSAGYTSVGSDAQKVGAGYNGATYSVAASLDWEADIWGRLRHQKKAAQADFLASEENRNSLQVSLIAEVATDYFILNDLDNRLAISQGTYAARHENTLLITARFDTGYVSELDKFQAIQQESVAASAVPEFERQINIIENALRVLEGLPPGQIPRGLRNETQTFVSNIPSGIPSELLLRRPDIRASNYQVEAEFNRVGVAKANQFPVISITGILGFASPELNTLLSSSGLIAGGAGGIFGPLFHFGELKHLTRSEEARLKEISYQYQETLLDAFSDVDNSLKNYESYSRQYDILQKEVNAAQSALTLSDARYKFGYADYTEVIIQQDNLFNAQLQESFVLQSKLNSIVSVYRSLGGGW